MDRFGMNDIESRVQAGAARPSSCTHRTAKTPLTVSPAPCPVPGNTTSSSWTRPPAGRWPTRDTSNCRGTVSDSGFAADRSHDEIIGDLRDGGGTWVSNPFTNPATHTKQLERIWVSLHGGDMWLVIAMVVEP